MKALLAITMLVVGSVLGGLLLSQLWDWFAVPMGAPAIGTAHALGLSLMAQAFVSHSNANDDDEEWWQPFVRMFARQFVFLVFGWIVHAIMVTH